MKKFTLMIVLITLSVTVWAKPDHQTTINIFKEAAGQTNQFFKNSYGYAVFPSIGKGGFGVGAAYGDGRVYVGGQYIGDTTMTQLSVGLQLGGEAYSEIIFFEDKRAFEEFTKDVFEFSASASAIAITSSVSATKSTAGQSVSARGSVKNGGETATIAGKYHKGMAVFTLGKAGMMYEAALSGQKYRFMPKKAD